MSSTGLALAVVVLVGFPLVLLVARAFGSDSGLSLDPFRELARQPNVGEVLLNTAIVVLVSVTIATSTGSIFAWLNERTNARMGWVTDFLPIVPLLVPPIAGAIGWSMLASPVAGYLNVAIRAVAGRWGTSLDEGPIDIYSWYGLIFVFSLYLVPYAYLTVSAALQRLDASLEEAARLSGSGVLKTLRDVTLPSIRPAVGAGALLATIFALAFFSVPVIIGTSAGIEVLAVRIVQLMRTYPANIEAAVGLGLIMVAIITGLSWLQGRTISQGNYATIGGRASQSTRIDLGRWRTPVRMGMVIYFAVTTVLPLGALILVSTQGFWSARIDWAGASLSNYGDILFGDGVTTRALRNSVSLAFIGSSLIVCTAGLLVTRVRRGGGPRSERAATGIMKLPGAVSNILIGVAFVVAFAGPPFGLQGSLLILLLAYVVVNMPQASITAGSAHSQIGQGLIEASRISGRGEAATFRRITFPLMLPGLASGWAMAFVIMVGDLTVSSMLAGPRNSVVGFQILALWEGGSYPTLAGLAVVLSIVSSTVVLVVLRLTRGRARRQS